MLALEDDAVVDFVADDPQVVLSGKLEQRVALCSVDGAPGRVGREVVEDGDRVFVNERLEVLDLRDKFVFKPARVVGRASAHQGGVRPVQWEVRFGKKDLPSGVEKGQKEVHQRVGSGHRDAHVVRRHTRCVGVPSFGDGLAKGRKTRRGRVLVPTVQHRLVEGFDGHGRGLEIRLAQTEGNGVLAGQIEHFANASGLDGPGTFGVRPHAPPTPDSLFKTWGSGSGRSRLVVFDGGRRVV